MTGVLFKGKLDGTIVQEFGPFNNVFGRLRDYMEFKKLLNPQVITSEEGLH